MIMHNYIYKPTTLQSLLFFSSTHTIITSSVTSSTATLRLDVQLGVRVLAVATHNTAEPAEH
jgi:hypothetical protein